GRGLRPGDPAAIFDMKMRKLNWMAVNPQEKAQIGHYYLLKRDYQEAWRWYAEVERELPAATPAAPIVSLENLRNDPGARDFSFFQYLCLTKLGRHDQARAKLEQFQQNFLPKVAETVPGDQKPGQDSPERRLRELFDPNGVPAQLLRDL